VEQLEEQDLWEQCPEEEVEQHEGAEKESREQSRSQERIQEGVCNEENGSLRFVSL
jgi:hypothetical protein